MSLMNEWLEYAYNKIHEDYMLVSFDNTVGYVSTNILLAIEVFIRRFYTHFIKHEFHLNADAFIKEYPLHN